MQLDEEEWRTTLTGKIAIGTPILVDEVDPLIEWLMRDPDTIAAN